MSEDIKESKTKVYLNYIDGSRVKKYEFNLKDPMDIRKYNQALKLDDDKRNTYLMLLAKKKLESAKDLINNTDTNHTIFHPNKLVDKRYDLSHNIYVQEDEKEELKELKKEKKRLAKERETATEERKTQIDNEIKELENREKIVEKNLEQEYDKDYETQTSYKTSTTKSENSIDSDIYKLLKEIDKKYGSKLAAISKRLKNTENTKIIVDEIKEEIKKMKDDFAEQDKILVAETVSKIEETAKQNNIKKIFDAKIKNSPENIKKMAKQKYTALSPANQRIFVNALNETPTKEEDITNALGKTTTASFSALHELLRKDPLGQYIIPLFQKYWNQIGSSKIMPLVLQYFGNAAKNEILRELWKKFIGNDSATNTLKTNISGVNLRWKYNSSEKILSIYDDFELSSASFKRLSIKFTTILDELKNIADEYNIAYGGDKFDFKFYGSVEYPKDPTAYKKYKDFETWNKLLEENKIEPKINKTSTNIKFDIGLRCNYTGAVSIFMNGVILSAKGFSFIPTVLPISILGQKIDTNNPISRLDELPIPKIEEDLDDEPIEEIKEEEIEAKPLPKELEDNPSEMENADGLGSMKDNDELIKSELQTIKSLLFTIIYKMNKKDKDKANKKNNTKSGNFNWLFD